MPIERQFIISICLIITLVMFINYIDCECGRPHRPAHGSNSRRFTQRFREDAIVTYFCNNSYRLVHDLHRVCKYGMWTGRPAICAKPIKDGITLEKVLIFSEINQELNVSDNYGDNYYIWRPIDDEKCISSLSTKAQNWTFVLNKSVIVNYLTVELQIDSIINKTNLSNYIKVFINKHRNCSLLKLNAKTVELEFICDSKSFLPSKLEERDKTNTISISFNLRFSSSLTICGLGLYRFPRDCGKIGIPLQTTIEDNDDGQALEASCEDGYELVGNSRVFCGSDSQWIGSPSCRPTITCPLITPINKYDKNVLRIEYKNGFYFNRTLMAVNETDAIHYCTKTNITRILYNNNNNTYTRHVIKYNRVCENGVWSEVESDCDTLLIDNGLIDSTDNKSSNFTLFMSISLFAIICVMFALSYYVFKMKIKQNKKDKFQKRSHKPLGNKFHDSNSDIRSSRYNSNRISDPFDDSVYAMVAEEGYEIIDFEGNPFNPIEQYDDVQTSKPIYLEILPLKSVSSAHNSSITSS